MLADAPAQALVTGQFGSRSTVHAELSEPVAALDVAVTAELGGNPASAAASLADVPTTMDLVVEGFSTGSDAGAPAISYSGSASTLDGSARVEAALIEAFAIGGYAVPSAAEAWVRVSDLGAETTVQVDAGGIVSADSSPATGSLQVGLSIDTAVPNLAVDVDPAFEADLGPFGVRLALTGHVGAPEVQADLSVLVEDVQTLVITPSPQISFLSTGLEGDYGRVVLDVDELFVRPDIDIALQIEAIGAPDPPDFRFTATEPVTSVALRLADQSLRPSGCASLSAGVDLFHVDVATLPGPIATGTDRIEVIGGPLPHTVTAIPLPLPIDIDPDLALVLTDLLTAYFTGPILDPPRRVDWGGGLGGC